MGLIDYEAAGTIQRLREEAGLSQEALAGEIRRASRKESWGRRGAVDAHTIRRIERFGHVPRERVRFVLSRYFGMAPHELWKPGIARVDPTADASKANNTRVAAWTS